MENLIVLSVEKVENTYSYVAYEDSNFVIRKCTLVNKIAKKENDPGVKYTKCYEPYNIMTVFEADNGLAHYFTQEYNHIGLFCGVYLIDFKNDFITNKAAYKQHFTKGELTHKGYKIKEDRYGFIRMTVAATREKIISDRPYIQPILMNAAAHCTGKVLLGGLGPGFLPYFLQDREDVTEIVVVENIQAIIDFNKEYLTYNAKVELLNADMMEYEPTENFDSIHLDLETPKNMYPPEQLDELTNRLSAFLNKGGFIGRTSNNLELELLSIMGV